MRVTLHVGHPGVPGPVFDTTLNRLPRVGEYIRSETVGAEHRDRPDADLWCVRAVVHEAPTAAVEATLYVASTDGRDIIELFDGEPDA
jgi:hypothetical protein